MKLQEVKDQYADSRGYVDWEDYYVNNLDESVEALVDEVAKLYAKAKLEEAAERAEKAYREGLIVVFEDIKSIKESITKTPLD